MPNLLQKASIVLTPTAYNDGEVLCAKPDDGSGDFDFSRNSAATRVNAQGLVENVQILSSNLVQNPSFSDEGTEEISNGSFSQEGSDIIVNGDFAFNSNWSGTNTIANGQLTKGSGGGLVYQGTLDGTIKSYKVTINVAEKNGVSLNLYLGGNQFSLNEGVQTLYVQSGNSNTFIGFNNGADSIINSISCVEVGQDWSLGTGWSIAENKAVANNVVNTFLIQNSILTSGKTYKITYTVQDYSSGSIRFRSNLVNGTTNSGNGTYTDYIVSGGTQFALQGLNTFNGSVTNISVKEVGMDWDLGTGWSIAENKAINDATQGYITQTDVSGAGVTATYKAQWTQNITAGTRLRFFARNYNDGGNVTILSITRDDGTSMGGGNCVGSGTFTAYVSSTNGYSFKILAETGVEADITNITTIEITDDTNLPRINYEGFSYQDDLGSEQVVNGGFDDGENDWDFSGDWELVNGTAEIQSSTNSFLVQSNVVDLSVKTYKLQYEVVTTNGSNFRLAGGNSAFGSPTLDSATIGAKTVYLTSNGTKRNLQFNQNAFRGSIDKVSVKEYFGQEVVPNSGCGSWLWEPQSTNHCNFSEQPSVWHSSSNVTITANAETSPQGISNASTVVNTTTNAYVRNLFNFSSSAATLDVTTSFFIKYTNNQWVYLRPNFFTGGSNSRTWFDIQNGVLGTNDNISSSIKDFGNGWYRCSVTHQIAPATDTTGYVHIYACDNDNSTTQVIGQGFAAFGSQGEEFSYSTSYIPTSGSTVTRNQDVCNNGGSLATINSTEGVLYFEGVFIGDNYKFISLSDGTATNRVSIYSNSPTRISFNVKVGGGNQFNGNYTIDATIKHKVALKYKENDFALWIDGIEVATDNNGISFAVDTLNEFSFDDGNGGSKLFGKTKAVAVWKEALSDEELADLTYPTPTDPTFSLDFDTIAEQFTFARGSEATYVDAQGLIQSTNEIEPEELVVNGGFDTDLSGWQVIDSATGIDITWTENGVSFITDGTGGGIQQSAMTIGKYYLIEFDYTAVSGGIKLNPYFGSIDETKRYSGIFEATTTNISFYRNGSFGNTEGLIDNVSVKEVITATNTPRLDYSTGAEAFLLEPQSTNLIPYSEDFSQWSVVNASVNANETISPDGTQNASKLNATSVSSRIQQSLSFSGVNTISIFVKYAGDDVTVRFERNTSNDRCSFDISSLGVVFNSAETGIIDYNVEEFSNDWYRISCSYDGGSYFQFNGDVTGNNGSVYIWGGQAENLSYPTSLIPSNGSQTTRNQETCINATPEINSEEGVLYFEGSALVDATVQRWISLGSGGNANRVSILFNAPSRISCSVRASSSAIYDANFNIGSQTNHTKAAIRYKNNDFAFFVNGVKVDSQSSGTLSFNSPLSELAFDSADGGSKFFGNTKDLQVYTKALSDAELINLTTI